MLTYIDVEINSVPAKGGIEIKSTVNATSIGDVTKVVVKRRRTDEQLYQTVGEVEISALEDLEFDLLDITVISGKSYIYSIEIDSDESTIESAVFNSVDFQFEGIFLGDSIGQFVGINYEITTNRVRPVAYVSTLSNRTPFAVSNETINYTTGDVRALFMKLDDDGKRFIPDVDHSYAKAVIDFLSSGTGKILKVEDGRAWYVSIDDRITEVFDDRYRGYNEIEFAFTEIGDVPKVDMLVEVN